MTALASTLLLVGLLVGPAGAVRAEEPAPPEAGSWTQLRADTPLGVTPDLQSQDGPALPVENGPLGTVAYSAVRFGFPADLTLARVDATATASSPEVWACPTGVWHVGDRQPWADRPAFDCTRHVVGVMHGDQVTWKLAAWGVPVDVVLVPAPGESSSYAVSFGAPTVDAFSGVVAPSPTPEPTAASPQPTATAARPAASPPQVVVPPVLPVTATAPSPAPSPAPVVEVAPGPAAPPVRAAVVKAADHAGRGQLLLAFLTLLLVVRAVWPSRPGRAPVSLLTRRAPDGLQPS